MNRITYLNITAIICSVFSCHSGKWPHDSTSQSINKNWKKFPDAWIDKALHFKYKRVDTTIFNEFSNYIKPDTITHAKAEHVGPNYGLIFNCISTDIDGDQISEVICLLGWDVYAPSLCVFKKSDGAWYLIYKEKIDTFYGSPTLYVTSNYSSNKTFYLRRVYESYSRENSLFW